MLYIIDNTGLLYTEEQFIYKYPDRDFSSLETIECDDNNIDRVRDIYYSIYREGELPKRSDIIAESFQSPNFYFVNDVVVNHIITINCSHPYDEKIFKNKFVILTD